MARETTPGPAPRPRHRRNGSCFFLFLIGGLLGALAVAVAWMIDSRGTPANPATSNAQRPAHTQPKPRYQYPTILPELEVVVPNEDTTDRPPALPPPPPTPEELKALAKAAANPPPTKPGAKEPVKPGTKEATKPGAKEATKPTGKETTTTQGKEAAKTTTAAKTPEKPPAKATEPPAKPPEPPAAGGDGETYVLQVASLSTPEEAERYKAKLALQGISVSIQQANIDGKTHYRVRSAPMKGREAANSARSQMVSKGLSPMMIKLK